MRQRNTIWDQPTETAGTSLNAGEALRWIGLAAKRGDAAPQNEMGHLFARGEGVERNDTEAIKWSSLVVAQGYAQAQFNLGMMYAFGRGVPVSDTEALLYWFRLFAVQGQPEAIQTLQRIGSALK